MNYNDPPSILLSPRTQHKLRTSRSHARAASLPSDIHGSHLFHQNFHEISTQTNNDHINSYFSNVNISSYNRLQDPLALTARSSMSFSAPEADGNNQRVSDFPSDVELLKTLLNTGFPSPPEVVLPEVRTRTQVVQSKESPGMDFSQSVSINAPSSSNSKNSSSGRSLSPALTKPKSRRRGRAKSPKAASLTCDICHQRYSRRDNLRTHQRVHSGEKPFQCRFCHTPFRWVSALRNHEALHTRKQATQKRTLHSKMEDVVAGGNLRIPHPSSSCGALLPSVQTMGAKHDTPTLQPEDMNVSRDVPEKPTPTVQSSFLHDSTEQEPMSIRNYNVATMSSSLSTTHSNSSSSNISNAHSTTHRVRMALESLNRHDDISLSEIFSRTDPEVQNALDAQMINCSEYKSNGNGPRMQ